MSQPKAITFASTMARFCGHMRAGRTFEAGLALGMASGVYKLGDREYARAQELMMAAYTCAMELGNNRKLTSM